MNSEIKRLKQEIISIINNSNLSLGVKSLVIENIFLEMQNAIYENDNLMLAKEIQNIRKESEDTSEDSPCE